MGSPEKNFPQTLGFLLVQSLKYISWVLVRACISASTSSSSLHTGHVGLFHWSILFIQCELGLGSDKLRYQTGIFSALQCILVFLMCLFNISFKSLKGSDGLIVLDPINLIIALATQHVSAQHKKQNICMKQGQFSKCNFI